MVKLFFFFFNSATFCVKRRRLVPGKSAVRHVNSCWWWNGDLVHRTRATAEKKKLCQAFAARLTGRPQTGAQHPQKEITGENRRDSLAEGTAWEWKRITLRRESGTSVCSPSPPSRPDSQSQQGIKSKLRPLRLLISALLGGTLASLPSAHERRSVFTKGRSIFFFFLHPTLKPRHRSADDGS